MTPTKPCLNFAQTCQARLCEMRAVFAVVALLLAACAKGDDGKPAPIVAGSTAAAETYPVRDILVAWDASPQPPQPGKKAPRPPAKKYGRTKEEALARAKEAAAKARASPDAFEAVAREMSDDEAARVDGGFVGFVSVEAGHLKSLVEAAAASPVGKVTDPAEGESAWHVMQLLTREEGKRLEAKGTAVFEGILVPWHDLASNLDPLITREAAYAKAAKVAGELRAGGDPSTLSGGIDGGTAFGGALRRATRPGFEALASATLALKANGQEWTDPVETPSGWALVRRMPYLRARVRQIAVAFSKEPDPSGMDPKRRSGEDAMKLAKEAYDKVKANPAAWDVLVAQYSDEPETRDRGGLVGDITNSDPAAPKVLEEIKSAVSRLTPGEISPPVPSRIGFHILRRDD